MKGRRSGLAGEADESGDPGAEPYLGLAREIRDEVERVASDESATAEALDELFAGFSVQERRRVVREVFERLTPAEQWAVVEHTFDGDEIADVLAEEREVLAEEVARRAARSETVRTVRSGDRLDVLAVPDGELLTLGLFLESDVAAGMRRGPSSTTCARRLSLKATDRRGWFQVIGDVFNPEGGYFVTARYDHTTWAADRLAPHSFVQVGSVVTVDGAPVLDPVLHLGGRVDVERDGEVADGLLHLGFALVGDHDLFADPAP